MTAAALWPSGLLVFLTPPLTDCLDLIGKDSLAFAQAPLFPPNQSTVLIQPAASEVAGESGRARSPLLRRLIIFDEFLLKDRFKLGGEEEGEILHKWRLNSPCVARPPTLSFQ